MIRSTLLFSLIAGGGLASAADLMVNDLRPNYMPFMGESFKMTGRLVDQAPADPAFTATDGNESVTKDSKSHNRMGLGYYRTFRELELGKGAFMWGVELAKDLTKSGQYNIHLDGDAIMLDGFLGLAWAFTPAWHLEEGLLLGVGQSKWDFKVDKWFINGSDWKDSYTSSAYEYGFRVGTYYTFSQHWQVGVDGRYLVMRSKAKFTGNATQGAVTETSTYEPTIQIDGLGATISVGYRF
ncbi:MAG: hypothetical protein H0W83_04560 [Planctomycetes bacterium]|nr:hypothetical protein [Planctomycetota bacterium]